MNVQAAEMNIPWGDARRAFRSYRALVKETPAKATKDDVALYRALRAIVRGQKVLDINTAIVGGGLNGDRLPKLAIARADWPQVNCYTLGRQFVFSSSDSWRGRRPRGEVRVTMRWPWVQGAGDPSGRAQVPMVPAQFRPAGKLDGYHILFEAVWERRPPVDPLLLRHLDGPFYVVLGAWDLSPLEQAVLRHKL